MKFRLHYIDDEGVRTHADVNDYTAEGARKAFIKSHKVEFGTTPIILKTKLVRE